jgi:hypothetical protein
LRTEESENCKGVGITAVTVLTPWFVAWFEPLVDPPLPGSEQFSLQQSRAIDT